MKTPPRHPRLPRAIAAALVLGAALLAGCSSTPPVENRVPAGSAEREAAISHALAQLDKPYRREASGPSAFDNDGFIAFVYRDAPEPLPEAVRAQLEAGTPIDLADARPADLVFFRLEGDDDRARLLVGLYLGDETMLMATPGIREDAGVRRLALDEYWHQRLVGVIRILPPR